MQYKEIFKNTADEFWFMSIATTGVGDHDQLIGAWFSNEQGNVQSFMCKGIDITVSQQYHRIPTDVYDQEAMDREEFETKLSEFFRGKKVLTYNMPFMHRFLRDSVDWPNLHICGIEPLAHWILTNQALEDSTKTISDIISAVSSWGSYKKKPIRKVLASLMPSWEPCGALPEPYVLAQALSEAWKVLGEYPVLLLQSEQVSPIPPGGFHAPPIPAGTMQGPSA